MKKEAEEKTLEVKETLFGVFLNEKQVLALMKALDLYSRVMIGQFETVMEAVDPECRLSFDLRSRAKETLALLKSIFGHPANGSYGIHSPNVREDARRSFDLYQVFRYAMTKHRFGPQAFLGVAGDVYPTSDQLLPKVFVGQADMFAPPMSESKAEWIRKLDELACSVSRYKVAWEHHTSSMKDDARQILLDRVAAMIKG